MTRRMLLTPGWTLCRTLCRPLLRPGLLAVATTAALGLSSAPSLAFDPPSAGTGDTGNQVDTDWSSAGGSGGHEGTVGGCHAAIGPSYWGVRCPGGGSLGDSQSIKEILAGDPLPGCWGQALTDAELAQVGKENKEGKDGWTWFWKKCLEGVDPQTLKPDNPHVTVELYQQMHGSKDKLDVLTEHQQDLVDDYTKQSGVPAPIAVLSPSYRPRVYQDIWFRNGTAGEKSMSLLGVEMRGRVVRLDVEPLGEGRGDGFACTGNGETGAKGDTERTRPNCHYRYQRSSADEPGNVYRVRMTAHWVVDGYVGGVLTSPRFAEFTKSQITTVPVTEVQTVVVP